MVLSDPEMVGQIKQNIQDNKVNAEAALKEVTDMYIGMFEAMDDNAYMQERAADIRDVAKRILAHLLGVTLPNPSMINEEVIVVAHDLTPSDTAQLDRTYVKSLCDRHRRTYFSLSHHGSFVRNPCNRWYKRNY